MDVRWISCPGEIHSRSHPDGLILLLLLPKALGDSCQGVQDLLTLTRLQGKVLALSEDLQHPIEELRADRVAEAEILLTPSVEDLIHQKPVKVLCLDLTRSPRIRYLLPLPAVRDTELSACQQTTLANLPARILSFSVDEDLAPEFRPNDPLPPVIATLRGLDSGDGETTLDSGILWGQASLVSADGRVAMARVVPDILGGSIVAPLLRNNSHWLLVFDDLVIRHSGYFKIHIALMQTLQREARDDGESIIEAPQELLSAVTSLIYVHAFARLLGRSGWEDLW